MQGLVRKALIVISDGDDNQSRAYPDDAIKMCQRADTILYTSAPTSAPAATAATMFSRRWRKPPAAWRFSPTASRICPTAFTTSKTSCAASIRLPTARRLQARWVVPIDLPGALDRRYLVPQGLLRPKVLGPAVRSAPACAWTASLPTWEMLSPAWRGVGFCDHGTLQLAGLIELRSGVLSSDYVAGLFAYGAGDASSGGLDPRLSLVARQSGHGAGEHKREPCEFRRFLFLFRGEGQAGVPKPLDQIDVLLLGKKFDGWLEPREDPPPLPARALPRSPSSTRPSNRRPRPSSCAVRCADKANP